jgi:hypothetical protein
MNPRLKHTIESTQQCAQTKLHKNAKKPTTTNLYV